MKKIYYIMPRVLQVFFWFLGRTYFKLRYSYKIYNLENLKELEGNKKGVIFASNHISEIDPIVIPLSMSLFSSLHPMFYVSREEGFYNTCGWRKFFYGGMLFKMFGAYPVYTGKKDFEISLKHHIDILQSGNSLCIFPEGGRSLNGEVGKGKPGVAFLSYRTNSVIIPVKIKGLYEPLAEKDRNGKTKLEVIFGKPIYQKDIFSDIKKVSIEDLKKSTELIMDKIKEI